MPGSSVAPCYSASAGGPVGYCTGPALASLGFGNWRTLLFLAAMLVGMSGFQIFDRASIARPHSV